MNGPADPAASASGRLVDRVADRPANPIAFVSVDVCAAICAVVLTSRIQGGQLARAASPAPVVGGSPPTSVLNVSVVPDLPSSAYATIGPAAPDPGTMLQSVI